MSYQVLARKWRPQTFKDMVGQDHISSTLCNAIKSDRIGHAYLFVGTRGTGKTTTARIFAKAINCENPKPDANPCDECVNCTEITAGSSMDVLEIDGASNNGVEDIRRLRDNVQYTPARCKYKVYIIDEVHMLSTAAWNALLKTLEEPPEHVKFLFATTEAHKVLPTILSRCQRFDLKRISQGTISRRLKEIASEEHASFDDSALNSIARAANGGMRDALSIMDQMIAFCSNQDSISEHDVSDVFGLTSNADLARITSSILSNDAVSLINELNKLADLGRNLEQLYSDLLHFSRNLMICAISKDQAGSILDLDEYDLSTAQSIVSQVSADSIQKMVDGFLNNDGKLRNTLNKRVFIEMTLVRIMKDTHAVSLNDILKRINHLRKTGSLEGLEVDSPSVQIEIQPAQKKTELNTSATTIPTDTSLKPTEAVPEEPSTSPEIETPPQTEVQELPTAAPVAEIATQSEVQELPTATEIETTATEVETTATEIETTAPETETTAPETETLTESKISTPEGEPSTDKTVRLEIKVEKAETPSVTSDSSKENKRRVIDDSYTLPYNTLIDSDYIEKARKKDPLKLGLKKYSGEFNPDEDTPGSAMGLYYTDSEKNDSLPSKQIEPKKLQETTPENDSSQNSSELVEENEVELKNMALNVPAETIEENEVEQQNAALNSPAETIEENEVEQEYTEIEETLAHSSSDDTAILSDKEVQEPQEDYIPAQSQQREEAEVKATEPVEKEATEEKAQKIWGEMQKRSTQAAKACSHVIPLSLQENTFIAGLEDCSGEENEKLRVKLEAVLQKVSGLESLELKFVRSVKGKEEERKLTSSDEVWERAKESTFFNQVCDAFDGKIIDVRG